MRHSSVGINGYNASLIGRFGVGDVGKYGFALGDAVPIAFPQTVPLSDMEQGFAPIMTPGVVDDSSAFSFLTPAVSASAPVATAPGQTSTSTALLFLVAAVGIIFWVK